MIKQLLKKFSSLLLRGHFYINRRLAEKSRVPPRILHYNPVAGLPMIFHFNGNFVVGGTSQLIADIVERTSDQYTHKIFVPNHPKPLPYQPLPVTEFPLTNMQGLYEYLEKEKPALVHIHYWIRPMHRYYDFGLWYRTVFTMCEELGLKVIQNVDVPTQPFSSAAVVHNVFVSRYVKDEFNNSNIASSVIYPGSDLSHFAYSGDHPFPADTIGMVYRLDTDKLNEKAIEVFIAAVKKRPGLVCYIIGGGYYLEYYKQRVKEEGQGKNFIFTGFVSYTSLPAWYQQLGMIVAPVHDESFGQVTPFAMSMGLPVAGYDTGALSEILGSKKMLVKYGDVNALADLIVKTMNDTVLRKQLGLENRIRAHELFSVEKMISDYEFLYKQYNS